MDGHSGLVDGRGDLDKVVLGKVDLGKVDLGRSGDQDSRTSYWITGQAAGLPDKLLDCRTSSPRIPSISIRVLLSPPVGLVKIYYIRVRINICGQHLHCRTFTVLVCFLIGVAPPLLPICVLFVVALLLRIVLQFVGELIVRYLLKCFTKSLTLVYCCSSWVLPQLWVFPSHLAIYYM